MLALRSIWTLAFLAGASFVIPPVSTSPVTPTSTSTAISTSTTLILDCQADNCLRQASASASLFSSFCSTYTTALQTATTSLPPFVANCAAKPSRISSACSCLSAFPVTASFMCTPDNCLRQFQQSSAVTPFCASYTSGVQTATTGLPDYVSQCNSVPSSISSACSCLVMTMSQTITSISSPTTASTSSSASTSISSTSISSTNISSTSISSTTLSALSSTSSSAPASTLAAPVQTCNQDNCFRQFAQSLTLITPFCGTYLTAVQSSTTALPTYVSQCQDNPSRISSACSCFVAVSTPTSNLSTSASSTTTTSAPTSPPAPPVQTCNQDNCFRQFAQSLALITPFCGTYLTAVETSTTALPTYVSQCQDNPFRISSACSCFVTVNTPTSSLPPSPPTSTPPPSSSSTSSPSSPPTSSPSNYTPLSPPTSSPSSSSPLPEQPTSPTTYSSPPSNIDSFHSATINSLSTNSVTSSSTPTNTVGVTMIFEVQSGSVGYYRKRQYSQIFVGAGGIAVTQNCNAAAIFEINQGQLTTGGQPISTNPGVIYQALTVSTGVVGNITTTFSVLNGYLSWQNINFTNGQAYFCEEQASGQIDVLFFGSSYENNPANCVIVSLLALPAVYCNNGIVSSPTPSFTPSTLSSQPTTAPGSQTTTTLGSQMGTTSGTNPGTALGSQATTSTGDLGNSPSLPPNIYPTPASGLQCITEVFIWSIGGTAFESMPTYARREAE